MQGNIDAVTSKSIENTDSNEEFIFHYMDRIESSNSKIKKRDLILKYPKFTSDIIKLPKNLGINKNNFKKLIVEHKKEDVKLG